MVGGNDKDPVATGSQGLVSPTRSGSRSGLGVQQDTHWPLFLHLFSFMVTLARNWTSENCLVKTAFQPHSLIKCVCVTSSVRNISDGKPVSANQGDHMKRTRPSCKLWEPLEKVVGWGGRGCVLACSVCLCDGHVMLAYSKGASLKTPFAPSGRSVCTVLKGVVPGPARSARPVNFVKHPRWPEPEPGGGSSRWSDTLRVENHWPVLLGDRWVSIMGGLGWMPICLSQTNKESVWVVPYTSVVLGVFLESYLSFEYLFSLVTFFFFLSKVLPSA